MTPSSAHPPSAEDASAPGGLVEDSSENKLDLPPAPVIAIVGVCASGKTTLANGLRARGYNARRVLQEHSYVPSMWQRISRPTLLIYLGAEPATVRRRRNDPDWPGWLLVQEIERLRHARAHCDLYIQTDDLTPSEVLARALAFLESF